MIFNPAIKGGKESLSWHQCPEAVRNYLAYIAEHSYSANDYTYTYVTSFAPSPAVPSTNTKPIGLTVDGTTFYDNVPNAATPFSTTNKAGTVTPLDRVRWIKSLTSNMRDLGGWACDGGTVKYGLLYRSGELNQQDKDLLINQLGIRTEIDLTADGTAAFPNEMEYIGHTSYAMYSLADVGAWRTNLRGAIQSVRYGEPAIFHCSMGADRTGTLACVLEGLLGVSQSDIDADYELTSFYSLRARNGNYQGGTTDWAHLIQQIQALSGSTFRDKCVTFALSVGITIDEINAYRTAMIDGTPETLSPTISTVTVTNTLTNVTNDNTSASINQYQPYTANLTPSTGYDFDSVDVTVGGVSVKAAAYKQLSYPSSKGVINIDRVTGNIVITASATQPAPSYTNQIPISTDANGNVYNVTGYKNDVRLNSSGAETAFTGTGLTGYIPFSLGDTIRVKQFNGRAASYTGYFFFRSDHSIIGRAVWYGASDHYPSSAFIENGVSEWKPNASEYNGASGTQMDLTNAAYIRLCVEYDNNPPADWICTINQEIT